MLGAAHVYLHPTLQTTAHEDDTIARLEKLHQALRQVKTRKGLASYKATTLAAQDAVKARANPPPLELRGRRSAWPRFSRRPTSTPRSTRSTIQSRTSYKSTTVIYLSCSLRVWRARAPLVEGLLGTVR